jgi:hypothetical protein
MAAISRRLFLQRGGAGLAMATALSAAPLLLEGQASADPRAGKKGEPRLAPISSEPVLAHVVDPGSGEVRLMVGTHELVRHDPDLVARLLRAAH